MSAIRRMTRIDNTAPTDVENISVRSVDVLQGKVPAELKGAVNVRFEDEYALPLVAVSVSPVELLPHPEVSHGDANELRSIVIGAQALNFSRGALADTVHPVPIVDRRNSTARGEGLANEFIAPMVRVLDHRDFDELTPHFGRLSLPEQTLVPSDLQQMRLVDGLENAGLAGMVSSSKVSLVIPPQAELKQLSARQEAAALAPQRVAVVVDPDLGLLGEGEPEVVEHSGQAVLPGRYRCGVAVDGSDESQEEPGGHGAPSPARPDTE